MTGAGALVALAFIGSGSIRSDALQQQRPPRMGAAAADAINRNPRP
jgi:hypothetical protein